jgi:hypothetical protein
MNNGEVKAIDLGFVNSYLIKENDEFFLLIRVLVNNESIIIEIATAGCSPEKLKLVIVNSW